MHWYYEERSRQIGPLTDEQFEAAVKTGRVVRNTLVWNESLTGWTPYGALFSKPPALTVQTTNGSMQNCSQCSRSFPSPDLIQYGGLWVCAACKQVFFQRLKEEGRVSAIWRDGKFLVAASETVLPDRCIKCNAPARGIRMKKKFYWHPPAFYLLICAGILIYAIVAMIVRKSSTIHMGICGEHKRRRRRSIAIAWSAVGISLILVIASAAAEIGGLALLGLLLFLGAIIFGIVTTQLVVPTRINNQGVIWLKGIPLEYLEGLPAYRPI